MELIFLAAIEIVIPLAVVMLTLTMDLLVIFGNLLALLLGLIGSALGLGGPKAESGQAAPVSAEVAARRAKVKRWALRIMSVAGGLLLILLAGLAVANAFFFESLTGWAFGQAEKRAGVSLKYDKVEGSLWTGEFRFRNLTAQRAGHPRSVFDFRVDSAEVDISMSRLILQKIVFDRLDVSGVTGSFERLSAGESRGKASGGGKSMKPRRSFVVNNFSLEGVALAYADQTTARPLKAELKLDHLRAAKLSGNRIIADLLFRSNAAGSFDGVAFSIVNQVDSGDFSRTAWLCDNLNVEALASFLGGPFHWFESGRVDVKVDNQSRTGQGTTMDWRLTFRDFKVQAPAGSPPEVKLWAGPVAAYLNERSDDLDLGFTLRLAPGELEFASTEDLSSLVKKLAGDNFQEKLREFGQQIRAGAVKSLSDRALGRSAPAGVEETAADDGESKGDKLKSLWKSRRDRKSGEAGSPAE